MPKQVVFVDGVGGKRYMRGGLIRFFSSRGYSVHCFDYSPSAQSLYAIKGQLIAFLREVAKNGEYFAIGYSFGGVLLRLVLQECKTLATSPSRMVLLASPVLSMRLARRVKDWRIYKAMTGECGQAVADDATLARISGLTIPTACIYGVWPWLGALGLFAGYKFPHDGMVAVDELALADFQFTAAIKASHAFIPANQAALSAAHAWFENVA